MLSTITLQSAAAAAASTTTTTATTTGAAALSSLSCFMEIMIPCVYSPDRFALPLRSSIVNAVIEVHVLDMLPEKSQYESCRDWRLVKYPMTSRFPASLALLLKSTLTRDVMLDHSCGTEPLRLLMEAAVRIET